MGLFSSKTKYYVSSSTFPLFSENQRVDNYVSGILDYTSNSTLEKYEYFKYHYDTSRLRDIRGFINWADKSGFSGAMGKIYSTFYGDAEYDNVVVTDALKDLVPVESNQVLQVYSTVLNTFSEDFWLKFLATQQGVAYLFFEGTGVDYTVSFPDDNHIKATFTNGKVVEGELPPYANTHRYLEISYSIETTTTGNKKDANGDDVLDPDTNEPIVVTEISYTYGYYHYREGAGNVKLNALIENNTIHGTSTFYPVIPIRTNTSWYGGGAATHIGNALKHLHMYKQSMGPLDCYGNLKNSLAEGISKSGNGSLGDIDYMTIILGIAINSHNQADQHYLFEFFYNLYANYQLQQGKVPELKSGGVATYNGKGAIKDYFHSLYYNLGYDQSTSTYSTRGWFSKWFKRRSSRWASFNIYNGSSNLNLTYDWGNAGYFEANGKWKPNARLGEYGVLAGLQRHNYSVWEVVTDAEGNPITHYNEDTGRNETEYELNTYTVYTNLILFCKQTSENRWKFVMFSGLQLTNLVYAGKSVVTDPYSDVKDSGSSKVLEHDFSSDSDGTYDDYTLFSFNYVENPGDSPSAFIVPLEQNTFYEVGVPHQVDISYGCQYLICNCWVAKKVKWYNRGWFSIALSFVGMSVMWWAPTVWTYFAVIFTVAFTAKALELLNKICVTIFGESFGNSLYKAIIIVVKTILAILASFFFYLGEAFPIFYLFWAICVTLYATITAAEYVRQGYDLWDAVKRGAVEGAGVAAGSAISGGMGSTWGTTAASAVGAAASSFISTTGNAYLNGESFGSAFKQGIKAGVISGATTYVLSGLMNMWQGVDFAGPTQNAISTAQKEMVSEAIAKQGTAAFIGNMAAEVTKQVLLNPNTYVNILSSSVVERAYHKIANLENDYQEFNNKLASAYKALNIINMQMSSMITAEYVAILQACLGRLTVDGTNADLDPEGWLTQATATGHDQLKMVLAGPSFFVDNKLSLTGYSPYSLHYTQQDYDIVFTETLQIN